VQNKPGYRWIPADARAHNLSSENPYHLESFSYDLSEVHNKYYPGKMGGREFIGTVDGNRILIECQDFAKPPTGVSGHCQYDFPLFDLFVNVHFSQPNLRDWKSVYMQTKALLLHFKEN
jgi:hypothetical protein